MNRTNQIAGQIAAGRIAAGQLARGCRCALLLALLAAGCGQPAASDMRAPVEPDSPEAGSPTEPVQVMVELVPSVVRLSDEPRLTLTIESEMGVDVTEPLFGDSIGEFQIQETETPLSEIRNGRRVVRRHFVLEPTKVGPSVIDPIAITYVDRRGDPEAEAQQIVSQAMVVDVQSTIDGSSASLDELAVMAPPMEFEESSSVWIWLTLTAAMLIVAVMALVVWRRRPTVAPRARTPYEIAVDELDALRGSGLRDRDAKQFTFELTGIVRRFIESTTGIRAAEQTTEEFLREISGSRAFAGDKRERLQRFLESADLIKFAAQRPTVGELDSAFERAEGFIEPAEPTEAGAQSSAEPGQLSPEESPPGASSPGGSSPGTAPTERVA